MPFIAMRCPSCGGPLPPNAKRQVVVCGFCGTSVTYDQWTAKRHRFRLALESERRSAGGDTGERLAVGDREYRLLAPLGRGEDSDVWLAERDDGVLERSVIALLRDPDGAERHAHAFATLEALAESAAPGTEHFVTRLPRPLRYGTTAGRGAPTAAAVYRYASGFFQTLVDVRALHGAALDAAHAVWLWRRVLETLAWLHAAGWVHRALVPPHWVVHARDHGVLLTGFALAAPAGRPGPLPAMVEPFAALYPEDCRAGAPYTTRHDVAMSARVIGWLLGDGDGWQPAATVPRPLAELIVAAGSGRPDPVLGDARRLDEQLRARARDAFGPPHYRHLAMPGW